MAGRCPPSACHDGPIAERKRVEARGTVLASMGQAAGRGVLLKRIPQREAGREEEPMAGLPRPFEQFGKQHRAVMKAYEALGEAAAKAGPLDGKTRELVKLGMAIGGGPEGGGHFSTPPAPGG